MDSYGKRALERLETMAAEEWVQKYGAALCHHYDAHEEATAASSLAVKAAAEEIRRGDNFAGQMLGALKRFNHQTGWRFGAKRGPGATHGRWKAAIQLADVCAAACSLFGGQGGKEPSATSMMDLSPKIPIDRLGVKDYLDRPLAPFIVDDTGREVLDESQMRKVDQWATEMREKEAAASEVRGPVGTIPPDWIQAARELEDRIREEASQTADVEEWMATLERNQKESDDGIE